jgi:hypothetical protein
MTHMILYVLKSFLARVNFAVTKAKRSVMVGNETDRWSTFVKKCQYRYEMCSANQIIPSEKVI